MHIFNQRSLCLLIFLALCACERPLPELHGMDLISWKKDKNGCGGKRTAQIEMLKGQKNKFQGLSEMQIIGLLGRPDQNELYKRNQKFYYYLLEPGKPCGTNIESRKLSVRFNALGLAKEIEVE
jgi:hypothetical protein